jgi:hypothetical protein
MFLIKAPSLSKLLKYRVFKEIGGFGVQSKGH